MEKTGRPVFAGAERVLGGALGNLQIRSSGVNLRRQPLLVSRIFVSWNQLDGWLRRLDALRTAA